MDPRTQQGYYYQQPSQAQAQYHHGPVQTQSQRPPLANHRSSHSRSKSRTFSFHSDKSHKSSGSKTDLTESAAEKNARRLHTKADPTLAMREAEPAVVAAMQTESSLAPLRSMQHKDQYGNSIADPDKSNPTRSRWERPLDTVRNFQAATEGGSSRYSIARPEGNIRQRPLEGQFESRRGPYYNQNDSSRARTSYHGSTYGQPSNDVAYDLTHGRTQSEYQHQLRRHPQNNYAMAYPSNETVNSAATSAYSEGMSYQTDPTTGSDNSSIDRRSPPKPRDDYGIGFTQPQAYEPDFTFGAPPSGGGHPLPAVPGGGYQQQMYGNQMVPRRQPPSAQRPPMATQTAAPEKRKSWFSRKFNNKT